MADNLTLQPSVFLIKMFAHSKLCPATTTRNFQWVKITHNYLFKLRPNFYKSLCLNIHTIPTREGHGAMVRAWRSADVAACRAVSNPAWIFREISCFSPLNLGTLLRCCVPGQATSPSNASLASGENEYLVGQRWQCVR